MNAVSILGVVAAFSMLFLSVIVWCARKGFMPCRREVERFNLLSATEKFLIALFVVGWMVFGGSKNDPTNSPPLGMMGPPMTMVGQSPNAVITEAETNVGYRVESIVEGDGIVPLVNATTNDLWRLRGGMADARRMENGKWKAANSSGDDSGPHWHFPYRDTFTEGLTVFANGEFRPNVNTTYFPRPFDAVLSLVPQGKWGQIANGGPSLFTHELTPSNSLMLSWQNALYNRDANCPTNFQAELFADGRFEYRYPDHTTRYMPVFPFDWDGDGLENSGDPEPMVAGVDAHGANAEWYNTICSNVFTRVDLTGNPNILPVILPNGETVYFKPGVNTNAYYFVDVVAERGPAPIHFLADGVSRLGNPVLVARAGETNHVPLLIGAEYCMSSSVPVSILAPVNVQILPTYAMDSHDDAWIPVNLIKWPSGLHYVRDGGSYVPMVDEAERLGGTFEWMGGCCLHLQGTNLAFSCHSYGCGGCSTTLNYTYEWYTSSVTGPSCGCLGNTGEDVGTPFAVTEAGGGVALGFSEPIILTAIAEDGTVSQSTRSVLTLAAWGGANGGTLSLRTTNLERLSPIGGILPSSGFRSIAPNESYAIVVTNEGAEVSELIRDVSISASFFEDTTGIELRRNSDLTVCAISLEGIKFNHDYNAHTNDAINIRLDGATNGVYAIGNGEWSGRGMTNCPACYVGATRPMVKARFTIRPVGLTSAVLGADASPGGFVLGNIPGRRVEFSGGDSGWVDFAACDATNAIPMRVGKSVGKFDWFTTNVAERTFAHFSVTTSGPHRVYTVLAHPTTPWKAAKDDPQCAWVYALERACAWADGATTTNAMMVAVASNLFYNMGFRYDTKEGRATYWDVDRDIFDLSGYLVPTNTQVNCYDQAYGSVALMNLLGGDTYALFTNPFGFIDPTRLVGVEGLCNNPFFEGTNRCSRVMAVVRNGQIAYEADSYPIPRTPLCEFYDYIGRSLFGNHMYVIDSNNMIFDACAGPVLGSLTFVEYLNSVVDHNTDAETHYSCFGIGGNPYGIGVPTVIKPRNYSLKLEEEP